MDNELTKKVIEWVETSSQKISDFATSEIPPFINEYLNWKFWEAGIGCVFWMVPWLMALYFICRVRYFFNLADKYSKSSEGFTGFIFIIVGVLSIPTIIFAFPKEEIKDMIQIKIAPKVYLIEKAKDIIKPDK